MVTLLGTPLEEQGVPNTIILIRSVSTIPTNEVIMINLIKYLFFFV